MTSEPITFFNRYNGRVESEQIYGEKPLRWVYESGLGQCTLEAFVKRPLLSAVYGRLMDRPSSRTRIAPFIRQYGLDPDEFADPVDRYGSFNAFFYRTLKAAARPICARPDTVTFPADGRHLAIPDLARTDQFFAKGQRFDLEALLGSPELAGRYHGGTLVLSRLCPVDYHRFHFCAGGTASQARLLNGPLYSVNPIALRKTLAYLWRNKRAITELATDAFGAVLQLEIGATNVGSIRQTFTPGSVAKGQEKGYFAFGGSAVITLFEPGRVQLADDLANNSAECRELYAHFGDVMATAKAAR